MAWINLKETAVADVTAPREWREPFPKEGEPPHPFFAVLEAAWRHPNWKDMPFESRNRYAKLHPDDPRANEFRVYRHASSGMHSMPLGSDREFAEMIVFAINDAFAAGVEYAERMAMGQRGWPIKVGRRGHRVESTWAEAMGLPPCEHAHGVPACLCGQPISDECKTNGCRWEKEKKNG